jgi:hypothetical protein
VWRVGSIEGAHRRGVDCLSGRPWSVSASSSTASALCDLGESGVDEQLASAVLHLSRVHCVGFHVSTHSRQTHAVSQLDHVLNGTSIGVAQEQCGQRR